ETRTFNIIFHGTDILEKIEIIRNGEIVATIDEKKEDIEVHWQDSTPVKQILLPPTKFSKQPFAFYYIRVVQKNREVVWASPVWIVQYES
ncbi:MAG: polyadenylate-binding protein 2, partial [bacterium]|nr:polyadenylate-binding protein 2 [bacterium]